MTELSLRFDKREIEHWASQYKYSKEALVVDTIAPRMRAAGYLTKPDFLALCDWKTSRSKRRCEENSEEFIRAVTQIALSTPNEQLRIEVLTLLRGVGWPTASVILHFGHSDPYPILDVRALWSLGVDASTVNYNFDFWRAYTLKCREIARECHVSMRVLDRALWQYSWDNNRRLRRAEHDDKSQYVR